MGTRTLLLLLTIPLFGHLAAQKNIVDRRDQADGWYLPVEGNVTINGAKAEGYTLHVYKDNDDLGEIKPKQKGKFELDLDLDNTYSIVIAKEGYQTKLIHIDTEMPKNQTKYGPYECFVNLEPADRFAHSDPFYLDFPSAVVAWDESKQAFVHSDTYLNDIQLKVALLGAQVDTQ